MAPGAAGFAVRAGREAVCGRAREPVRGPRSLRRGRPTGSSLACRRDRFHALCPKDNRNVAARRAPSAARRGRASAGDLAGPRAGGLKAAGHEARSARRARAVRHRLHQAARPRPGPGRQAGGRARGGARRRAARPAASTPGATRVTECPRTLGGAEAQIDRVISKDCGPVTVVEDYRVDNGSLTLEAGATLQFKDGAALIVGASEPAKLLVAGTPAGAGHADLGQRQGRGGVARRSRLWDKAARSQITGRGDRVRRHRGARAAGRGRRGGARRARRSAEARGPGDPHRGRRQPGDVRRQHAAQARLRRRRS